jgi:septum formation protein
LILASASKIRYDLLAHLHIICEVKPAQLDERGLESKFELEEGDDLAKALAQAKALDVSQRSRGYYVLGADQTCQLGQIRLHKPRDLDELRYQLREMAGKTHELISAASIAKDNEILISVTSKAHLTMRNFSDKYLNWYIDVAGKELLKSVGGYQIERLGQTLMAGIDGDINTIMGLPLLPLLREMREIGLIRD